MKQYTQLQYYGGSELGCSDMYKSSNILTVAKVYVLNIAKIQKSAEFTVPAGK